MSSPPQKRRQSTLEVDAASAKARRAVLASTSELDTGRLLLLDQVSEATLGRHDTCTFQLGDPSISGTHARVATVAGDYVIIDLNSTNGTFVNDERVTGPRVLKNGDAIRLGAKAVLRFTVMGDDERDALRRLYETATYDRLTQIHNRSHLDERLTAEVAFAVRHGTELAAVLVDLDHFKQVNDTYGHLAGDAVLKAAAAALSEQLRTEDLVARYGGEEFVVLFRGVDRGGIRLAAERLRHTIAALQIPWVVTAPETGQSRTVSLRVTASLGMASVHECAPQTGETLLALADERLYRAKRNGRDCLVAE